MQGQDDLLLCPFIVAYSDLVHELPTALIYSNSSLGHGIELLCMSYYSLHRRTRETEEQEKHYNYAHLCTECLSVWLYFSNASWLSKHHNSTVHKMNLLLYDLIWARKTTKRSNHCNFNKDKKLNPFPDKVDCTTPAAQSSAVMLSE